MFDGPFVEVSVEDHEYFLITKDLNESGYQPGEIKKAYNYVCIYDFSN